MTQLQADPGTVETGGWYTYEFSARKGVRCGLAGCRVVHEVVYVGKTNEPWRRHFEHLKDKDWLPLTSGYRIHDRVYDTEAECLAAEKAMIRHRSAARRPLANDVHNRDNPHRLVFVKTAPAVRAARRTAPARMPQRIPAPVQREWTDGQRHAAYVAAVWTVLSGAAWWAACRYLLVAPAAGAVDGAVAASTLLVAIGALVLPTKGRGAARRKFWRVLGLLAAAAGLVFLLWHVGPHLPAGWLTTEAGAR